MTKEEQIEAIEDLLEAAYTLSEVYGDDSWWQEVKIGKKFLEYLESKK